MNGVNTTYVFAGHQVCHRGARRSLFFLIFLVKLVILFVVIIVVFNVIVILITSA